MPPRFAYWTIILEGKPTAFRAQQRDDLLPTFRQLQAKHPDAVMKWFTRGRLWASPEEAQAAERAAVAQRRKRDWRPGGEHRDPRARFEIPRDEKRRRFAAKLRRDRDQRERPEQGGKPPADRSARGVGWRPREDRHREPGDRKPFERQPPRERVGRPTKPQWRPGNDRDRPDRKTSEGRPPWERERHGQKPDWKPDDRRRDSKPGGWRPKPPDWKSRPPGEKGPGPGGGPPRDRPASARGPGGKPPGFRPKGPGGRRGGFRPDQRNRSGVGRKPGGGRGGGRGGGGRGGGGQSR